MWYHCCFFNTDLTGFFPPFFTLKRRVMSEFDFAHAVSRVNIETEMKQSYLDYAMSVIVGRALPDVRDGLKPVHRRVLFAMNEMGNVWNKPHKKSARIVGDVIGKYHPHGDSAVYDAIVRMAQQFSLRYVLVDGQGNFGSVDGDAAAAMRYTETRMSRIAHELLHDIDKETVDFVPNYDGAENEPTVLPTRVPNLLINGSSGIAVGMATNIPPHNLSEVINACKGLIENPDISIAELIRFIPGPDFPTAGIINGSTGIHEAYRTGRGKIYMRARLHVETDETDNSLIVVTELPYQVNKKRLLEKIAELVKNKKITGIRGLRDESDKDGMRMVIELRRNEVPEVMINNLYKLTQIETVFGINIVALNKGRPRLMNLKELLEAFLSHRREVVTRRCLFDLGKTRTRARLLEGLAVALVNIDPVIALIKQSASPAEAKQGLMDRAWAPGMVVDMVKRSGEDDSLLGELSGNYGLTSDGYRLSPEQAQAILELRLQKLTSLEQGKIVEEFAELLKVIEDLLDILSQPERLERVISEELEMVVADYGDGRKTEIIADRQDLSMEDLIIEEDVVVTLSYAGYAKLQPIDTYRSQRRGGKGKTATSVKDEDFIDKVFMASTHDTILCFSNRGQLYWLKVYELPQASRVARGKPLINLLPLDEGERINAILPVRGLERDAFVLMATMDGTIKKTPLIDFSRPRASGIRAIELTGDNQLIGVELTDGQHDVLLFSNSDKAVRFHESNVRPMGRTARGVRGIKLGKGQKVISLVIVREDEPAAILTATENGYGKRSLVSGYPQRRRGGSGVKSMRTSDRNGNVIGAALVEDEDEIMLISNRGKLIRFPVRDISVVSRNTQGVRLVDLNEGERLTSIERIMEYESNDAADEPEAEEKTDEPEV